MDPGHVFKDCPDLKCYECEEQGHYASNCNAVKCTDCKRALVKCECWMENEEAEGDDNQIRETEILSVDVTVSGLCFPGCPLVVSLPHSHPTAGTTFPTSLCPIHHC